MRKVTRASMRLVRLPSKMVMKVMKKIKAAGKKKISPPVSMKAKASMRSMKPVTRKQQYPHEYVMKKKKKTTSDNKKSSPLAMKPAAENPPSMKPQKKSLPSMKASAKPTSASPMKTKPSMKSDSKAPKAMRGVTLMKTSGEEDLGGIELGGSSLPFFPNTGGASSSASSSSSAATGVPVPAKFQAAALRYGFKDVAVESKS